MAREGATRVRLLPDDYARILSAGVLISYVLIVVSALFFRDIELINQVFSGAGLLSASFIAALVCFAAWRSLPATVNVPWLIFGLAATFGTLSHTGGLLSDVAIRTSVIHYTWVTGYALFVTGIVVSIQQSERGRWPELGMDAALVMAAATLVMLRWAPGIHQAMDEASFASGLLVLFGPVAAFCAALFMVVLLVSLPAFMPKLTAVALAGSTIALIMSALPQAFSGEACCHDGSPGTAAAIGMWVFLTVAGATAMQAGGRGLVIPQGERLRQFVAPTVAVILAGISIDTSLNPPVERRTAIVIGVLAVLVALRLTQLLQATRTQVAERRELAQTRALMEVSRALAGADDLDKTLRTVTEWARRVLNAEAAVIELLSADGQQLELRATTGLPQSMVGNTYTIDASFTGWVAKHGEARVTVNAAKDPLIGSDTGKLLGNSTMAAVPLRFRERILGVLTCIGTRSFDVTDLELLNAFANQAAVAIEDADLFDQVRTLSVTDSLTGLANRRRLDRELEREFAAARRGRRLVAVMFDLDEFKEHNDRYGHLAGDRALRHFADALNGSTRAMNLAARYGGDEFFALLADGDRAGAQIFVERVTARFQASMRDAGNPVLGVSAGIAEFKADMETAAELVEAADRALYISKSEAGSNK